MNYVKFAIIYIFIIMLIPINGYSYQIPPMYGSDVRTFGLWTVIKMNENGTRYISLCTPLGNDKSAFRIHLGAKGEINYTISLYDPMITYPESVTEGQAMIYVGGVLHSTQISNVFNGNYIVSYLNLSQDFITQLKHQHNFIIQFAVGAPFNISLLGFNEALKYAIKLQKTI